MSDASRSAFERIALPNFRQPAKELIEDHWQTWQEAWEEASRRDVVLLRQALEWLELRLPPYPHKAEGSISRLVEALRARLADGRHKLIADCMEYSGWLESVYGGGR